MKEVWTGFLSILRPVNQLPMHYRNKMQKICCIWQSLVLNRKFTLYGLFPSVYMSLAMITLSIIFALKNKSLLLPLKLTGRFLAL